MGNKYDIEGLLDPTEWKRNTIKSIIAPSSIHAYSLAIEYMKDRWFLPKFDTDFFKTVYVNGKHVFADQRNFNQIKTRQIVKPAVAITPTIDIDWNRDNVDLYVGGLSVYTHKRRIDNRLFRDDKNNIYLTIDFKQMQMQFDFHVRVSTKAEQYNLLEKIRLACRIGSTQDEFIHVDCILPKDVINAIAKDAGYNMIKLKNGRSEVEDITSFIKYLNSISREPITYKFRGINGEKEYFVRLTQYVHISCLDGISKDEGEKLGQLDSNFHIDFSAIFQMSTPGLMMYYSKNSHIINNTDTSSIGLYQLTIVAPPDINSLGWNKYLESEYIADDKYVDTVSFLDIFDTVSKTDDVRNAVLRVMEYSISIGISPSVFMEIQIFNDQRKVYFTVDWENFKAIINDTLTNITSNIAIYIDLGYVNTTISNLDMLNKDNNRIE